MVNEQDMQKALAEIKSSKNLNFTTITKNNNLTPFILI
jgi:hypothetical protein